MWLHFRVVYCCSKKQILLNAKTKPEKFVTRMKELLHRARSEHDWKDWKYDCHPMWEVKSHWRCIDTAHKRKKYTNIKVNSTWRWHDLRHEIISTKAAVAVSHYSTLYTEKRYIHVKGIYHTRSNFMERPKIIILATVPCQLKCIKNNFSSCSNKLECFCTCSYFALSE